MRLILCILLLFSISTSYAVTDRVKTICPGGGCHYTTLYLAEDGEDATGDLVSLDQRVVFVISGTWVSPESSQVIIDGWTTDPTRNITVLTTNAARHSGVWSDTAYRIVAAHASSGIILMKEYGVIDGLQLHNNQSAAAGTSCALYIDAISIGASGLRIAQNCILKGGRYSVFSSNPDGVFSVINCAIYGGNYGAAAMNGAGKAFYQNCTMIGVSYGINAAAGTVAATNCYASGPPASFGGSMTKQNCASSDATGNVGLQNIPYSTANFMNVTAGSEDLHLKSGSAVINAGADLSATLTTDIRGATRSGTFDIGAFEYTLFPRVRYVKSDGSGHYSTLALAEDAEDASGDLVALNEKLVLVIDGTWASADGVVTVDGFTTDATRNITIYATNSARHDGKWKDTAYRILNPAGSAQDGLWIVSSYVTVIGIQFENQYGGGDYAACFSQGNSVVMDGCIARFTGTEVADSYLIGFQSNGSNNRFQNCISYGFENGGYPTHGYGFLIYTPSVNQTVVMNCTAVDNGYGFSAGSGGADFTNCIAQGNYVGFVSSGLGRFGNNKSDVATDVSNGFATLGTVTFVNAAAGDYHLSASDTVAKNNGANYSGLFNSDVDGAARGYVWDIGADDLSIEAEPAGQAVIPTFFILRGGRF